MDQALATSIQSIQMNALNWVIFILTALIGSFASSLINNKGAIERMGWDSPKREDRKQLKIGLIADLAAGLAAALAILWTMTPQTFFQLIGIAAVAGYGGSAVLQALVNRLTADVSSAEKKTIEAEKNKLEEDKKVLVAEKAKIQDAEASLVTKKAEMSIIDKIIELQS
jgi:hypothetical protein